MNLIGIFFLISGGMMFLFKYKHLLMMLLSLEVMMLSIFMLLSLNNMSGSMSMLMIFLGFSVCEGGVGLGLLVYIVRIYGSDYFNNFSVLWC